MCFFKIFNCDITGTRMQIVMEQISNLTYKMSCVF